MRTLRSASKTCRASGLDADSSNQEIDVWQLLGAYAFGTLSPKEERRLHSAALIDQALFDALGDEDLLRTALSDQAFRKRLRQRLLDLSKQSSTNALPWMRDWLGSPTGSLAIATLSLVIALSAVAWLLPPWAGGPSTAGESSGRPIQTQGLLPPPPASPAVGWDESASSLEFLWNSADPTRGMGRN